MPYIILFWCFPIIPIRILQNIFRFNWHNYIYFQKFYHFKFHFLLSSPVSDPDGLPAVIRFDRKTKAHYVRSEKSGKPTGWRAIYGDGNWVIMDKRKK